MSAGKTQTQVLEITSSVQREVERREPVLVVVQGEEIGRRYLLNERRLILGRDPEQASLVLPDPSVSGKHAMLQVDREAGRYGLIDLGSRNGTYVNGRRVEGGPLREGDKIFVGGTVLKLAFHDPIEEKFHGELDQLMHVDSLTGLYVRRWFDQEYPRAFARAARGGHPFCVLMMDMDGLKAINDRHGHQLGSHCIAETGRIIKACIDHNGAAARFGGDEFVAWVTPCELDQALDGSEDIRGRIEAFHFEQGGVVVAPTISIGVAELEPGVESAEALMRLADDALYRAKKAGRNTVST